MVVFRQKLPRLPLNFSYIIFVFLSFSLTHFSNFYFSGWLFRSVLSFFRMVSFIYISLNSVVLFFWSCGLLGKIKNFFSAWSVKNTTAFQKWWTTAKTISKKECVRKVPFEMSTWSESSFLSAVLIVHATLIMGRQLKAYDDCGHNLHMVWCKQHNRESGKVELHTSWEASFISSLSGESLVAATGKNDRCMLQYTVHSTQLFTKPFCSFRCTVLFFSLRCRVC